MNSKQRRQQKRWQLKMANGFIGVMSELLDDIEQEKHSIEFHREQLDNIRELLKNSA